MEDISHFYLIIQIILLISLFILPFLLLFILSGYVGARRSPIPDNAIPPPLVERPILKPSSSPPHPTHKSPVTKYDDQKPSSLRRPLPGISDVTTYQDGAGGKILGDPYSF